MESSSRIIHLMISQWSLDGHGNDCVYDRSGVDYLDGWCDGCWDSRVNGWSIVRWMIGWIVGWLADWWIVMLGTSMDWSGWLGRIVRWMIQGIISLTIGAGGLSLDCLSIVRWMIRLKWLYMMIGMIGRAAIPFGRLVDDWNGLIGTYNGGEKNNQWVIL